MLNNPAEYEIDTSSAEFKHTHRLVSPASPPCACAGYCPIALVDELGMIITQMGNAH
jgi:hypothetical protein